MHGGLRAANEAAGDSAVEPFHGPSRGGGGWRSPDAMPESYPTRVTGYRDHGLQRLVECRFGRRRVESLVDNPPHPPTWQEMEQTWRYEGDGMTVIVNEFGKIVTAF